MLSVKAGKIKKLFHTSCMSLERMQMFVVADLRLHLLSEEDGDEKLLSLKTVTPVTPWIKKLGLSW